jgi:hypothetical protein
VCCTAELHKCLILDAGIAQTVLHVVCQRTDACASMHTTPTLTAVYCIVILQLK